MSETIARRHSRYGHIIKNKKRHKIFCYQASKEKLWYETEEKAKRAMEFHAKQGFLNKEMIYFCQICGGYHLSSDLKGNNTSKEQQGLKKILQQQNGKAIQEAMRVTRKRREQKCQKKKQP
jgi:hypothetical protein